MDTRIFLLLRASNSLCLWRMLEPSGPYPVGPRPMKTSNLVSHGHIRGGPFFEFFRSNVCSQSYEVKHASSPHAFSRCACARVSRSAHTLDRSKQLLFSCSPPNYALFKRYYVRAHVYVRHARARACRVLSDRTIFVKIQPH